MWGNVASNGTHVALSQHLLGFLFLFLVRSSLKLEMRCKAYHVARPA